jgi:hypothetical protein
MLYIEKTFISYHFEGWKVQGQGVMSGEGLPVSPEAAQGITQQDRANKPDRFPFDNRAILTITYESTNPSSGL